MKLTSLMKKLETAIVKNDFKNMSSAIGFATLVILKTKNESKRSDYSFLIAKPNEQKNAFSEYDTIPSGMYQPFTITGGKNCEELDLKWQVLREIGEELFSIKSLRENSSVSLDDLKRIVERHKFLNYLNKNINIYPHITLKITSISFDVLRLRPEITMVLVLDDEFFYKEYISNYFGKKTSNIFLDLSENTYLDIIPVDDEPAIYKLLRDRIVPSGAMSVIQGLKYLNSMKGYGEFSRIEFTY